MATSSPIYDTDVLIIGAGAAGLLAARQLAEAGRRVLLLEARDYLGGRAHTLTPPGFTQAIEAGAEFMHGEVPLTRALLAEAGIGWQDTAGRTYLVRDGETQADADFFAELPRVLAKLEDLSEDLPLTDFLAQEFPGDENAELRTTAIQFAEGYDAADAQRVSSWALRDEWQAGGAEDSPRPVGGYGPLFSWLAAQAQAAGAVVHLATPVQEISWQPGQADVTSTTGTTYRAQRVLCTAALGVWQRPAGQPGYLGFSPDLPAHRAAAAQLGFGEVIKFVFEFKTPFWQERLPELEFLLSEAPVPTWWSQLPDPRPLLTGWVAGTAAQRLRTASTDTLLELALASLSQLLHTPLPALQAQLCGSYVRNWGAEAHVYGAYSYPTVGSPAARAVLAAPVANTLFWAGEGLYAGPAGGTVEAALVSGQQAAQALLATWPT